MDNIKEKFGVHARGAKARNIPFTLTFNEWWDIWQQSGHWEERGHKSGQYCMSRYGDLGPYAVGNVFIQLTSENSSQAHKGRMLGVKTGPQTAEHKKKRSDALKGVKRGPYKKEKDNG